MHTLGRYQSKFKETLHISVFCTAFEVPLIKIGFLDVRGHFCATFWPKNGHFPEKCAINQLVAHQSYSISAF